MVEYSLEHVTDEERFMQRLLSPLREGKPVCLSIKDSKMRTKPRIPNPVLFIIPTMDIFGVSVRGEDGLMFALQGGGCEVLPLADLNHTMLYRIGLTMHTSRTLVTAINRVLLGHIKVKEKTHA